MKKSYDLIHIHYGISAMFLLFYRPKVTVLLTLHGSDILRKGGYPIQVFITKMILRKVDTVFVQNIQMAEIVKKINENCEIIPCGVDTDFFKPNSIKMANSNVKTILFPGNPSRKVKNFPKS